MGDIKKPTPALLLVAVSSKYPEALDWSVEKLSQEYGRVCLQSPPFVFDQTTYYESTMGTGLVKKFVTFEQLIDPAQLPKIKHHTNQLEIDYSAAFDHPETRPLNLDPGYLTEAKLILASTKDHWHRIYLSDGIYAEFTLHYQKKAWQNSPWTYPDYQTDAYKAFFDCCRQEFRKRIQQA